MRKLTQILTVFFCYVILIKCMVGIVNGESMIELIGFALIALDRLNEESKKH